MNVRTAIPRVSAAAFLALLADSTETSAQTLLDRARAAVMTVVSSTDDEPTERLLWSFKRPISFSHLGADTTAPLAGLMGQALASPLIRDDCLKEYFEAFERIAAGDPDDMADEIAELEQTYLKEVGLADDELATYKEYKASYEVELKRLSELPKEQAESEAYLLRQLETDWEIFGFRHEFEKLEERVAELRASTPEIDVAKLKDAVFSAGGALRYSLSVPIEQWLEFDSWIYHRKNGGVAAAAPATRPINTIKLAASDLFNTGSCQPQSCNRELRQVTFAQESIALEILAPRIDLPWLAQFRIAISHLSEPVKGCETLAVPDRLVLMRGVSTAYNENQIGDLTDALKKNRPFDVGGLQFSGKPDIGTSYPSSLMFMNGGVTSPFTFILGFTSQDLPAGGK